MRRKRVSLRGRILDRVSQMNTEPPGDGTLLIFNLKTDAEDNVLGFTTRWIEEFAREWGRVIVVTMQAGALRLPPNVQVYSVGREHGWTEFRRLLNFIRIMRNVFRHEKISACFSHMNPLFVVLAAPWLSSRNFPVALWYVHMSRTRILHLALWLSDSVVTANRGSFPIDSFKVRPVGHGIPIADFPCRPRDRTGRAFRVISAARISRIKKLDRIIEAIAILNRGREQPRVELILLGAPQTGDDKLYLGELRQLIGTRGCENCVHLVGGVPPRDVAGWLYQCDLAVNLSPPGLFDKAVLEALASGIPVLFGSPAFADIFDEAGVDPTPYQIGELSAERLAASISQRIDAGAEEEHRRQAAIAAVVARQHALPETVRRISNILRDSLAHRSFWETLWRSSTHGNAAL